MTGSYQPRYSPRFRVEVAGQRFQEPGGRIADLVVETTVEGADRFSFTLHYPFDEELGTFDGLDWEAFAVGTEVSIAMGYGGDGTLTPLLSGRVHTVESAFTPEQGPTVTVSGFGLLKATMAGTNSDSWTETTLGRVAEDVLSGYAFSTVDVDADVQRQRVIQDRQSDYRFLAELARTYGYEFTAERETVRFRPRGERRDREPVAELWYGEALQEFHAEIRDQQSDRSVQVRSWDQRDQRALVGRAGPSDASAETVYREHAMARTETDWIATQKHSELADGVVTGHGEADGRPALRAGVTVELAELGDRFSGTYAVTQATHRMGSAGYRTSFEVTGVST